MVCVEDTYTSDLGREIEERSVEFGYILGEEIPSLGV
jgi:hypothetical protein